MSGNLLPAGFQALEPFVEGWAIEGSENRLRRRLQSTPEEREAFFEAAMPLVQPALAQLDKKRLTEFDAAEQRLMNLMLSMAHVAHAVEVQREDEPFHAEGARHITITRSSADSNPGL
ncbi:hypothetical protein E4634_06120 [Mangrovimicrobium sediminis]|uniref:Uncharacterized protein n=1 Tax=Mangrovimicrobium sediminis TaxID=2562682 RepID=A0A4Z0M5L2_9GAMM|nr:hypothetical protein [Haliea sp. SAOS-164]TGD74774.1 hypothetical protein E4634_06120 [Haliea sp. SAOS-164]